MKQAAAEQQSEILFASSFFLFVTNAYTPVGVGGKKTKNDHKTTLTGCPSVGQVLLVDKGTAKEQSYPLRVLNALTVIQRPFPV